MGGNIYMFIQTIISIVLSLGTKKGQWRRRTAFLRLVISILTATLIAAGIGTGISSATHSDEGKQQFCKNSNLEKLYIPINLFYTQICSELVFIELGRQMGNLWHVFTYFMIVKTPFL